MTGSLKSSSPPAGNVIDLERVRVTFGGAKNQVTALAETSMRIAHGEFIALVGPSGCGKSTILKLVAGTLSATEGNVFVGGREVGAENARIGMAFQNPTLLPWLNIRDNVMMPLKIVPPFKQEFSRKRNSEYRDRVEDSLARVGLRGFGDKFPWQLSGGMQQRASLCRALIHDPSLLMLDEPFASLDMFTREELWLALQDLWLARHPTVILVTHDLREAVFLADRVLVMSARPGRIIAQRAVDLPRPRTLEMTYELSSVALVHELRERIGVARVGA
jgi:NitT/TauT family transport system ATP-binding protein